MKSRRRIACPLGSGPRRPGRNYSRDLLPLEWLGSGFAQQQFGRLKCRYGSKATFSTPPGDVGLAPHCDQGGTTGGRYAQNVVSWMTNFDNLVGDCGGGHVE